MSKTLRVSEDVHEYLRQLGEKGESFDAIIRKLIALRELLKKGLWETTPHESPEGISRAEFVEQTLRVLNELQALIGEPQLTWSKDEGGRLILMEAKSEA